MASFNVRLPHDLAARFDAWAQVRGGRSPALRQLIGEACGGQAPGGSAAVQQGPRSVKLTVRLRPGEAGALARAAADMGLTPNGWVAALVRRRLVGRPRFRRREELALLAIHGEVRRIGVNLNQIARALNTAVLEGRVLELELSDIAALRRELRAYMLALGEAFEGNLAYWAADGA